jgi:hypothetical protein
MTTRMLFHAHAVPVNRERHSDCFFEITDYKVCRGVNAVPLMAPEFTLVARVLRFLQDYRAQFLRTRAFGRRLFALGLLERMQALVPFADGQISLGGFNVVNRRELRTLAGEHLGELARADALQLVYLHLQSLRNFDSVGQRLPTLMPRVGDAPVTGRRAPQPIS